MSPVHPMWTPCQHVFFKLDVVFQLTGYAGINKATAVCGQVLRTWKESPGNERTDSEESKTALHR